MSQIKDGISTLKKFMINPDDYQTVKKIKSGGFGSVYSIIDKKTKKKYAAKILTENEQDKKMINREIGIMIRLQHPTIVKFHGYSLTDFEGQNNVTIIMNLAENGSLETVLQSVKRGLADSVYDFHREN